MLADKGCNFSSEASSFADVFIIWALTVDPAFDVSIAHPSVMVTKLNRACIPVEQIMSCYADDSPTIL